MVDNGQVKVIPTNTKLIASYSWTVDLTVSDEKIVSVPFGPRDWSWQAM
jgi:hypothetical protein